MKLKNRLAREEDITYIAEIKVAGWQTAYRGIVDESYLNALSVQEQATSLMTRPLASFLVAERDGHVVGFSRIVEGTLADGETPGCEIREFYVRPDLRRQGIGTELFKYTVLEIRCRGYKVMSLGVFEENEDGIRFYEKMGGKLKDKGVINLSGKSYPAIEYVFDL